MTGNDSPDHSHQSKPKGELGMKSELISLSKRINFPIVNKIVGTILLLGIIFLWTLFLIVVVPMVYVIVNHGKSQKQNPINLSIAMIPAGFCGLLIWRMWYPKWNPNQLSPTNPIRKVLPAPMMKRTGK